MRAKMALIATSQSKTYEIATVTAIRYKLFSGEGSTCTKSFLMRNGNIFLT